MARQRMRTRLVWVAVLFCLGIPLLIGSNCLPARTIPLAVSAGDNVSINTGSSTQLMGVITGGTAPYTVAWTPADGLSNPSSLTPTFTPAVSGTYNFTLTVTDDNGEVDSDSVTVTVTGANAADSDHGLGGNSDGPGEPVPLTVGAGPDRTVTVGNTITLQGTAAGGVEPYQTISWTPAPLLVGASTLTPTFTPTTTGDFTFTLKVTDGGGTVEEDSVLITVTQMTTLQTLTWGADYAGPGYQLIAAFSKPVDKATAERVTSYRVTGTEIYPASAILDANGQTVTLIFSGTTLTAKSEFDIGVNDGILDANGGRVPSTKGLSPTANAADTKAPQATTIRWAINAVDDYGVEVVFSESVDEASAESIRAYQIKDGTLSTVAFTAVLGNDGRTVSLTFHGLALSVGAKLDLGLLNIRDINGKALVLSTGKTIAANTFDVDPPTIVTDSVRFVGNYAGGGYQVTLQYGEVMDRISAQDQTAYGINGTAPASAEIDSAGRRVKLTWPSITLNADSKLAIAAGKVKDINGRALPAQNNLTILPAGSTGSVPSSPVLTWLKGSESTSFQFRARFNEAMDKATVEETANWRISGTDIRPTSVVLSNQTAGEDIAARTALVTFDNFGTSQTRLSRTSKIDVSVNSSIKNVNGDAMPQASLSVVANSADIHAPTLVPPKTGLTAKPMWGDVLASSYSGANYQISVVFNETMDAASALEPRNYYLAGMHPTSLSMDGTGRKLVLAFATTAGPIKAADKLQIMPNVRDINGHTASFGAAITILASPDDTIVPAVADLFWGANRGPYELTVTFDEVMDAESATTLNAYRLADSVPTAASVMPDGKSVTLVFGNALCVPTDEFDIVADVRDINGKVYDHSRDGALPGAPRSRPEDDKHAPALISVVWASDSLDYRMIATFSEAIRADNAIDPSFYVAPSRSGVQATSAALLPGGTSVELVFTGFDPFNPPFNMDDMLYVVTAAGPGGTIGVEDMHGNLTAATTRMTVAPNLQDTLGQGVMFPLAIWEPDYVAGGYRVRVTFANEVLDRASAENPTNYRITDSNPPINPQFATLEYVNDVANGIYAGRTVTLEFGLPTLLISWTPYFGESALSITSALDVSLGYSVVDLNNNGIPEIQGIPILADPRDVTSPTVVAVESQADQPLLLQGEWIITFSEAMDWDSAINTDNYTITAEDHNGVEETYNPTRAWLAADGMTVFVQFTVSAEYAEGGTLHIEGVTDINGLPMAPYDEVIGG